MFFFSEGIYICVLYGGIIVHLFINVIIFINNEECRDYKRFFHLKLIMKHVKSIVSSHYLSPKQDVPSFLFSSSSQLPMLSLCSLSLCHFFSIVEETISFFLIPGRWSIPALFLLPCRDHHLHQHSIMGPSSVPTPALLSCRESASTSTGVTIFLAPFF